MIRSRGPISSKTTVKRAGFAKKENDRRRTILAPPALRVYHRVSLSLPTTDYGNRMVFGLLEVFTIFERGTPAIAKPRGSGRVFLESILQLV